MNFFNFFKSKKEGKPKKESQSKKISQPKKIMAIDFLDDCSRDLLCGITLMDCETYNSDILVQCNSCKKSFNSKKWVSKLGNYNMVICPNCRNSYGPLPD